MNFEPPDSTKNLSSDLPNNRPNFYSRSKSYFQDNKSPLLRPTYSQKPYEKNPNAMKRNNPMNGNVNNYNPVHNRLGQRNDYRNNNSNNVQNCDKELQRNFNNRKRQSDGTSGPPAPKRKWNNKRNFYHPQNSGNKPNLAKNRMDRIKNTILHEGQHQFVINNDLHETTPSTSDLNESQEIDATDITVEVINNTAAPVKEQMVPERFKMVLDPKTQQAIKTIQAKRKDKQVISPLPVTPNVTAISLHERFSSLL